MKKIPHDIVILVASLLLFASCKGVLDVAPQNIIPKDVVFADESTVEAYMASLLYDLPIEDFRFSVGSGFNAWPSGTYLTHMTDEALGVNGGGYDLGNGDRLRWWGYSQVRNANAFIASIESSPLAEEKKRNWLGEAKFIRAYYYFAMVKRFGGVPLITSVQNFDGSNLEELQVPRNSEKELYDFIAKELDEAVELLNETSPKGRPNKYVAYALKSRAMLYAGAIAKYGTVQLDGLLGFPASEADSYWQAAYDAAKAIIDSKKYALYEKNADKTQNFQDLFLDGNNTEIILAKDFRVSASTAHGWDLWNLPYGVRAPGGYGSRINPTLELSEQFEYIDGTEGTLRLTDGSGNAIRYDRPADLFQGKDPRFAATIIYPFSTWRSTVIDVQAGIIDGNERITAGDYNTLYKGEHVIGLNGIGGGLEVSQTGFYIRKYLNPAYDRSVVNANTSGTIGSEQQYIEMRYAEVLLNFAEAAAELGGEKLADAKIAINAVRTRAGIRELTDSEVTVARVRHERQIELAFENHRYWDIRRWRIADQLLNNSRFMMIMPFRVMDDNTYIFEKAQTIGTKTFLPKLYYEQIDPAEITRNPKLIQNPLY
ncbi:MAG: RagB/SusD family nutrient uptake outer membrane protein [Parapedobacter sp.]|nr:MAG: RagB/SusD family nutrient uptake outer membrane protein [Parapedobacter sp.]